MHLDLQHNKDTARMDTPIKYYTDRDAFWRSMRWVIWIDTHVIRLHDTEQQQETATIVYDGGDALEDGSVAPVGAKIFELTVWRGWREDPYMGGTTPRRRSYEVEITVQMFAGSKRVKHATYIGEYEQYGAILEKMLNAYGDELGNSPRELLKEEGSP